MGEFIDVASAKRAILGVLSEDNDDEEVCEAARGLSVTVTVFLSLADILRSSSQS